MSRDLQQQRDNNAESKSAADVDVDAEHKPEVSRKSSNAGLRREVQMKAGAANADPAQVHDAAQQGIATPGTALPHQAAIQRAFGSHDISGVQAHVGASGATGAMGAQAYATGNHVVFGQQPDLHTAAHEVAHVVQQRNGVNLAGGVGVAGDAHEQQADKVADKVVAGESVEHLLGPAKPAGGAAPAQAVQKKPAAKAADPAAAHDTSDRKSYDSVQSALKHLAKEFYAWMPQLDAQLKLDTSTEAGDGPAANTILAIYERAKNDTEHVGELISVASKSERGTLSPDVKLVQGAYRVFWKHAATASKWLHSRGHDDLNWDVIEKTIDGYASKLGLEDVKLEPDFTAVDGDEKTLSKAMVTDQFTALGAALDSVKAGNDSDIGRVTDHTRYLGEVAKEHAAEIKTHKPQLKAYFKELAEIQKEKPGIADQLNEAYNHLLALLK